MTRTFLFLGGPLHAEVKPVEQLTAVQPTTDTEELYPIVWTDIASASSYSRRKVAHVADASGDTWTLIVYVHESIQDPQSAQIHLGDAMAHRYFVEHGTKVENPGAAPHNGRHSSLIVPGQ